MTAGPAVLALDVPATPGRATGGDADDALRRPVAGGPDGLSFVEDVARLAEGDRCVLVLHPRHRAAEVLPAVRLARLVLRSDRVLACPTDLPPLAAGVLTDLLLALVRRLDLDAGRAAALVPELADQLLVLAWVRSVARLRRPEPSLGQHLLSPVARRGFEVTLRPGQAVRRLRAESVPAPAGAGGAAVLAGADRDRGWLTDVLAAAGVRTAALADPDPYARRWYGTARVAQLVIAPADLDGLAAALAGRLPVAGCDWCGMAGPGDLCPFCGARRPGPEPLDPAPLLVGGPGEPDGDDPPAADPWLAVRPRPADGRRRPRHAAGGPA